MTSKGHHLVDAYWLEMGALREQNRIISLLKAKRDEFEKTYDWDDVKLLTYTIALIKGDVAKRRQTQMSEYGDKGEKK